MPLIDLRTLRVLTTALLFLLVLSFLYVAHHSLMAFLFAVFFAYLVDPAVSRIEKWTHSRGLAIGAIYLSLVMLLGVFVFAVGPQIGRQTQRLSESLPGFLEHGGYGALASQVAQKHGWNGAVIQQVEDILSKHEDELSGAAQQAGFRIAEVAQQSWLLVVVPILAIFFLKDGRAFSQEILAMVNSRPQREFLQGVVDDLNQMLAQFIRAQLILAAVSFVAYIVFLGLMRVPYALVLAAAGGAMEFVPLVGPLLAAALMITVALATSYEHWVIILIFLAAWRIVQDYVLSPRIMGRSTELHPLAALFGVLAGAEIAGVLGIYLSIPIMASLRIVWRRWRLYAEKRRFGPLNEYSFGDVDRGSSPL